MKVILPGLNWERLNTEFLQEDFRGAGEDWFDFIHWNGEGQIAKSKILQHDAINVSPEVVHAG